MLHTHWVSRAFYVLLAFWLALQWFYARPPAAAADWMGWRQADTAAIARNFRDSGENVLHPQIDWRGAGPGYVETEFQLYTYAVAKVFPVQRGAEWPAQFISLTAIALATALLFGYLAKQYSPLSALLAATATLANLGVLHLATAIQPDALCFLFYTAALLSFHRFIADTDTSRWLWISAVCVSIAALIKSPALHIGVIEFAAVLWLTPRALRLPKLWLSWTLILAVFALYILAAHRLYERYGNTFGIGFGGDAKWPGRGDLVDPRHYYALLRLTLDWGIGYAGMIGGLALLLKRRLTAWECALALGFGLHLIISMRYSSSLWLGPHYHVFGAFLGAWLVAHALHVFAGSPLWEHRSAALRIALTGMLGLVIAVQSVLNTYRRVHHAGADDGARFLALAALTQPFVQAGDRVAVRSVADAKLNDWSGGKNNYEDPRLFYLTDTKGWVFARDDDDPAAIARAADAGAELYIHIGDFELTPRTEQWLRAHAVLIARSPYGSVYRLAREK